MKNNPQSKIQEIIKKHENLEQSSKNEPVLVASMQDELGELEENPLGDEWEDDEHICYVLRRRPGESPGLELWFKDNSVQIHSYSYFRAAILNQKQDSLTLLFSGAKVKIGGRNLVQLITPMNERKVMRLLEQDRDLDNGVVDEIFIYGMLANITDDEM